MCLLSEYAEVFSLEEITLALVSFFKQGCPLRLIRDVTSDLMKPPMKSPLQLGNENQPCITIFLF